MRPIKSTQDFVESILSELDKKGNLSEIEKHNFKQRYFHVPEPPSVLPPPLPNFSTPALYNQSPPENNQQVAVYNPSSAFPPNDIIINHRLNDIVNSIFLAVQLEFKKKYSLKEKEIIKSAFIEFYKDLLRNFTQNGY